MAEATDSYIGRWARWYQGLDASQPQAYGDVTTYILAAAFLQDCAVVEDWGCGKGFFSTIRPDAIGVDGTDTPFTKVVADLVKYRSQVDGVLLRHVLEHNYEWERVLDNAVASAREKLCVVLFTPCAERTCQIAYTDELDVPDMSFAIDDLVARMEDFEVQVESLETNTQYGEETILRATRTSDGS